jgi:hypothetical protein
LRQIGRWPAQILEGSHQTLGAGKHLGQRREHHLPTDRARRRGGKGGQLRLAAKEELGQGELCQGYERSWMAAQRAGTAQNDGGGLLPGLQNVQRLGVPDDKRARKLFFFEKKNQKTSISLAGGCRNVSVQLGIALKTKVFFFP